MKLFGKEILSDIKIKSSMGIIPAHKSILVVSQPFVNLIINENLSEIVLAERFPDFDEKIVISYIRNLYDRNDIDYENILELLRFVDFACDDDFHFNYKKIKDLDKILCDMELDSIICKELLKNITFKQIGKIFKNNVSGLDVKIMQNLIYYKENIEKEIAFFLKSYGVDRTGKKYYYGNNSNILNRIIEYKLKNINSYQEKFINNIDMKIHYEYVLSLIKNRFIINKDSYIVQYFINDQNIESKDPNIFHVFNHIINFKSFSITYYIENPDMWSTLGFTVHKISDNTIIDDYEEDDDNAYWR